MAEQDFIKAGFSVIGTENNENKLLTFLKENYPSIIKDNEIDLNELKTIAGLPVDEKVNGYGLNFVGRNFARAKYAQKTEKELRLNTTLSKNIDTTENLVLKGDNLDSLKILKNHYSGKIKCIYIDPPYNTANDEFVYPDKFNKEEAEVLGLANLSDDDYARMDFSFKTKKSHNGWLAFMYPRLLLARDLLSKDGVIFISIDDNEQANARYSNPDNDPRGDWTSVALTAKSGSSVYEYTFDNGIFWKPTEGTYPRLSKESLIKAYQDNRLWFGKDGKNVPRLKKFLSEVKQGIIANSLVFNDKVGSTQLAKEQVKQLLHANTFDTPKPIYLIQFLMKLVINQSSIILDFFAGSGTTGHAVMQLNAEDGGNRKFILCQIDEPIKKDKPAYKFCMDNNLPPVISSITIERLKRAGEKIAKELEAEDRKPDLFEEDKKQFPDIGFKVFDSVDAPKLKVDETGQIIFPEISGDTTLSRIYNMIFTVGIDEPTQVPKEVVKDCIYKVGNNYYITNSKKVTSDDFSKAIKNGKVFIDGWTASLNGTLLCYKEDVKIVF